MEKWFCVYIIASKSRVIYTGITSNLPRRTWQHKPGTVDGFTHQYWCTRLVWYESWSTPQQAIAREKQIKGWRRAKKVALIERLNPTWEDLADHWYDSPVKTAAAIAQRRYPF